jgi:hypothetical protein
MGSYFHKPDSKVVRISACAEGRSDISQPGATDSEDAVAQTRYCLDACLACVRTDYYKRRGGGYSHPQHYYFTVTVYTPGRRIVPGVWTPFVQQIWRQVTAEGLNAKGGFWDYADLVWETSLFYNNTLYFTFKLHPVPDTQASSGHVVLDIAESYHRRSETPTDEMGGVMLGAFIGSQMACNSRA